jgi:hypothetical protein
LPPDVREWLPENGLADREDGHGRAAYEPSMMIAFVVLLVARRTLGATHRARLR